jgi:hypothetical protein
MNIDTLFILSPTPTPIPNPIPNPIAEGEKDFFDPIHSTHIEALRTHLCSD